jgi:hypothetical protein
MIPFFDYENYLRMLARAFQRGTPGRARGRLLFLLLLVVPVAWTVNALFFFLDVLVFPGVRRVKIEAPVFIVGHARSGTTLTHRLLVADHERFSHFVLWELLVPSLLLKKLVRWLADVDRRRWGSRLERRMRAFDDTVFAESRKSHPMSFLLPEEDIFLFSFCPGGAMMILLPFMGEIDFYYVDEWPERKRRRLMRYYRAGLQRQLYLNGAHKTHCCKSPDFTGRVETLIRAFPDARFVITERNPYETIPSLLKLMEGGWRASGWPKEQLDRSFAAMAQQSYHAYTHPLAVLDRHPNVPRSIVDYRDLVASPKAAVEKIYADLGLAITPEYEKVLVAEEKRARSHETTHRYSLEEFGLDRDAIHTELADLFARFRWEEEDAQASEERAAPSH